VPSGKREGKAPNSDDGLIRRGRGWGEREERESERGE